LNIRKATLGDRSKIQQLIAESARGLSREHYDDAQIEAAAHGFRAMELLSTLPGVKFYKACGYTEQGNIELDLTENVKLGFVPMRKELKHD